MSDEELNPIQRLKLKIQAENQQSILGNQSSPESVAQSLFVSEQEMYKREMELLARAGSDQGGQEQIRDYLRRRGR